MSDPTSILAELEHDANALRIKKLLLYACKNWWENDPSRLSVISLSSLVEELRQSYPTIEQLRSRLNHLVGTLNKSAEYAPVAQTITSAFERLYEQSTIPLNSVDIPEAETILRQVVSTIEQNVNLSRIKKLLICVCQKYWEANAYVIEQTKLRDLIEKFIELCPNVEAARSTLSACVKTLNKPMEYALIAENIIRDIEPLYGQKSDVSQLNPSTSEAIDLFDVRVEILKYANPLQAKILLFSSAYYLFEFRTSDWTNLRLYSLDGLLRTVLSQTDSIDEFEQTLQAKAKQLADADFYLEIVSIIARAIKPQFHQLQHQLQRVMQTSSVADMTCAGSTQFIAANRSAESVSRAT